MFSWIKKKSLLQVSFLFCFVLLCAHACMCMHRYDVCARAHVPWHACVCQIWLFLFYYGFQQIQLMSSSLEAGDPLSDLTSRLSLRSHFLFFPQAPGRDHEGTWHQVFSPPAPLTSPAFLMENSRTVPDPDHAGDIASMWLQPDIRKRG